MFPRIRHLREDSDLTQVQISKILNISQRAYSHYENGTRDIPTDILIKLADYYNVSTDYILGRVSKKNSPQNNKMSEKRK
jgi:transcriptional regulator with XRE-family HTH domain